MKTLRSVHPLQWAIFAILAFMFLPLIILGVSAACAPGNPHQTHLLFAVGSITMLDLAKANCSDVVRPLVEESVGAFPELTSLPANQLGVGELRYQALVRDRYPTAAFRDLGAGLSSSSSGTKLVSFETFPVGARVQAAKTIADQWKRGGPSGYFAFEALGVMKTSMFLIAKQIWYGRGGADGKGFPGLKNFTPFGATATDPITGKVYAVTHNAGGTTADTGSSCYLVVGAPDSVELQFGTGSVFDLGEPIIQDITDPNDAAKILRVYASELEGWAGLQTLNVHGVRRITNLTDDSGKGMTDARLALALASFPTGVRPSGIYMSSHQRYLLQLSRTVVLQGQGTNRPNQPTIAPVPTEYDGIPIYATDAIGDADAIEVAAAAEE